MKKEKKPEEGDNEKKTVITIEVIVWVFVLFLLFISGYFVGRD